MNPDSSDIKMTKNRGGQRKHWAEKIRVWIWYHEIKRRCDGDWTDYKLDNVFAWTEEGRKSFSSADDHPRMFEWIRKEARKPAGRDKRWRGMPELVKAVEQHPLFKGAQVLYEAEFWTLLQEDIVTPQLLQNRIDRLLLDNGLIRIPYEKLCAKHWTLIEQFGRATIFDRCLRLSIQKITQPSRAAPIELIWSLYLQNEPAHNWEFRAVIERIADYLLDHFFRIHLPDDHFDFYDRAVDLLRQVRLDMSSISTVSFASLEDVGSLPILPQELVGKISAERLGLNT